MTLKTMVPDARLIFLHREPTAVVTSQLRAIRSLLASRNDYVALLAPWYAHLFQSPLRLAASRWLFPRAGLGVRIVERHVARVCDYFVRWSGAIPEDDRLDLRYEDLCADPAGTIATALVFAGGPTEAARGLAGLIEGRASASLLEVDKRKASFGRRVRPYCAHVGYAG